MFDLFLGSCPRRIKDYSVEAIKLVWRKSSAKQISVFAGNLPPCFPGRTLKCNERVASTFCGVNDLINRHGKSTKPGKKICTHILQVSR